MNVMVLQVFVSLVTSTIGSVFGLLPATPGIP